MTQEENALRLLQNFSNGELYSYWDFAGKSHNELVNIAATLAKESNRRLKELESAGYGDSYDPRTTRSYLSGMGRSPEEEEAGRASYATKNGLYFLQSKTSLRTLSNDALIDSIRQSAFHLGRKSSTVEGIEGINQSRMKGMEGALASAFHMSLKEVRETWTPGEIIAIFENEAYRNKEKGQTYKHALRQVVGVPELSKAPKLSPDGRKRTETVEELKKRNKKKK